MTPQRFAEIDRLVSLALERERDGRASFVEQTCGADAELRDEVETLLKCHEQPGVFLSEPSLDLLGQFSAQEKREEDREQNDNGSLFTHDATVGRYVITGELGSGGMGCVYAAYDPELDRKVAIKLMRPEGLRADRSSDGRARLLREAQAMARLSHPNVIAVHDVGTFGPQVFIAMEYVEGGTLGRWLSDRKRSCREVVSMFIQAGRGLTAAHAAGIVHRDFKPDNVLVDMDGRARVFDFGLARPAQLRHDEKNEDATAQLTVAGEVPASGAMLGAAVTQAGKVLGTPDYMAPEQLMGEVGDEKADQFSFCVALHQGLCGELPFRGESVERLLDQIKRGDLRETPRLNRIPGWIRRALRRGLRVEPARRFASIAALLENLERGQARFRHSFLAVGLLLLATISTASWFAWHQRKGAASRIQSLAVLPLQNSTGDPSQDYFFDGTTEALITNLAQVSSVSITSSASVMRYKRAQKTLSEIARELNVDAILKSSMQPVEHRIHLSAELIRAATGGSLWAKSYEGELSEVMMLQAELATDVAAEIESNRTAHPGDLAAKARKLKPQALAAHLKGRFFIYKFNEAAIRRGMAYFDQALREDPNYAAAYAGLADGYMFLSYPVAALPPKEAARLATAALEKALSLDPTLGEAHASLGLIKQRYNWDWASAEQQFKRAIELSPNYAQAHRYYSMYLVETGRLDEAMVEFKQAEQLATVMMSLQGRFAGYYVAKGNPQQAILEYRKAIELDPNYAPNHAHLAAVYHNLGMYEEAFAEVQKDFELTAPNHRMNIPHFLVHLGRAAEAERILDEWKDSVKDTAALTIAITCALLGRKAEALEWLEHAYEIRAPGVLHIAEQPDFKSLRSEPRFQELVRRIAPFRPPRSNSEVKE